MSITEDLKNVSEAALGRLAAQFGDLPRPLLAAIGAGDVAVERLVRLRDQLGEMWNEERDVPGNAAEGAAGAGATGTAGGTAAPGGTAAGDRDDSADEDGGSRLADATRRAQQVVEDVAHKLGDVVGEVPDKAQKLIADLPAKAQEVANALSREKLKETVESYTKKVADVYRELADRGGARVRDAEDSEAEKARRAESGSPTPRAPGAGDATATGPSTAVVKPRTKAPEKVGGAASRAGATASGKVAPKRTASEPPAKNPAAARSTRKPAAPTPAASKPAAPTPAASKPAAPKPAAAKPPTAKPAAPKPTGPTAAAPNRDAEGSGD
jgi:hypothetical protein